MKAKTFYNFKKTQVRDKLKIRAMIKYITIQNMTMSKSITMMKKKNMKINLRLLIQMINLHIQR